MVYRRRWHVAFNGTCHLMDTMGVGMEKKGQDEDEDLDAELNEAKARVHELAKKRKAKQEKARRDAKKAHEAALETEVAESRKRIEILEKELSEQQKAHEAEKETMAGRIELLARELEATKRDRDGIAARYAARLAREDLVHIAGGESIRDYIDSVIGADTLED